MKRIHTLMLVLLGIAMLGHVPEARADRMQELQAQFKERLPQIDRLKQQGKIGETWEGWIEKLPQAELNERQRELVEAENSDRAELYQIIARKEGTTSEFVARKNAERNRKNLEPGEWFKMRSGEWEQK